MDDATLVKRIILFRPIFFHLFISLFYATHLAYNRLQCTADEKIISFCRRRPCMRRFLKMEVQHFSRKV